MPRRIYTYDAGQGWEIFNLMSTWGAVHSGGRRSSSASATSGQEPQAAAPIAGNDPWGAPSLEWSIPSPPPEYNFADDSHRDVALSAVGREVAGAHGRSPAHRHGDERNDVRMGGKHVGDSTTT